MTKQLGTVTHMPPELLTCNEMKLTAKADVYAAGILLWQAMKGESPWKNMTQPQVIVAVATGKTLEPPEDTPQPLVDIFSRCTAQDPAERPSFMELVEIFQSLRGRL